VLLMIHGGGPRAAAQTPAQVTPMSFRTLMETTPQPASPTNRVRELRIRWTGATTAQPAGQPATGAPAMVVIADDRTSGSVRRERNPQLSSDQLVVVQRSSDGRALDWVMVPDPRIVRAEVPGADGRLTGRTVLRDNTELLLTLTQLPATVSLSVYQPRWTGVEFLLDLVGEVALPRIR